MKKILSLALACIALTVALDAVAGGNIQAGKAVVEKYNCASCHGKDFNTPIDPSYPKLAGQHRDYLEHALIAYQRGDGANGRSNAIMAGQVKQLSKQEIHDIAAY